MLGHGACACHMFVIHRGGVCIGGVYASVGVSVSKDDGIRGTAHLAAMCATIFVMDQWGGNGVVALVCLVSQWRWHGLRQAYWG